MYCNSAGFIFNEIKELVDDINWWWGTIRKDQIVMFDSLLFEPICIIGVIIKSYDHGDTELFKHWYIISWGEDTISIFINCLIIRRTERNKLSWNNPVEITVLYFFIMLIFVKIKLSMIEPSQFHCIVQAS